MALPVTGPFIVQVNGAYGTDKGYWSYKVGYRQAKPHDRVLAYERMVAVGAEVGNTPYGCGVVIPPGVIDDPAWTDAANKVLEKFKGKLGEEAGLAVNILERKQSIAMIASRAAQLGSFVLALKRFDFGRAAKILRLAAVPKGVSVRKSVSSNWLEYHFGWRPLIKDIHSSIEILQGGVPPVRVKAGVALQSGEWFVQPVTKTVNPYAYNDASYTETWTKRRVYAISIRCGATVRVTNPNLWLANQLGFVNPFVVGYNVIPFSFVLDWFVNVEQFLSQGTDYYGLALEQAWTTKRYTADFDYHRLKVMRYYVSGQGPDEVFRYVPILEEFKGNGVHMRRSIGLPAVVLKLRPLKLPSWQRALTAVSLVVQRLR